MATLAPRPARLSDALAAALLPQREKRAREILKVFPIRAVQWSARHWSKLTVPTLKPKIANKIIALLSAPSLFDDQHVIAQLRAWHFDLRWTGNAAEIVALPAKPIAREAALEKAAAEALELARREADAEAARQIEKVAQKYPVIRHLKTDADPEEIKAWAKDRVEIFKLMAGVVGVAGAVDWGCRVLGSTVTDLPDIRSRLMAAKAPASLAPSVAWDSMWDEYWWRTAARKQIKRARGWSWATLAPLKIEEGVSSEALQDSQSQDEAGERWAKDWQAVDDATGETVAMTGPEQARKRQFAEILATASGIGELADLAGAVPYLVTITCPERMHPTTTRGGHHRQVNQAYDQTSTEEALGWLRSGWARARAAMGRAGLGKHWMRALEPHQDGTPHFHIIFWADATQEKVLSDILRRYFEAGASASQPRQKHGVQIKKVEGGTAGAIAYLATYISKGTAGLSGEEGTAERYRAWRRTYGARAFAFSHRKATLWRTLKRVKVRQADAAWRAQEAAKAGQFALFWAEAEAAGLGLWKETETGEDLGGGYHIERVKVRGIVDKTGQVYLSRRFHLERKPKPNENDSHPCPVHLLLKNQGAASRTRERMQTLKKMVLPAPAARLREILHHTAPPAKPILEKLQERKSRNGHRGGERARALREKLGKMEEARAQEAAHALGWLLWLRSYFWGLEDPPF